MRSPRPPMRSAGRELPAPVEAALPLVEANPRPCFAAVRATRQLVPNAAASAWLGNATAASDEAAWGGVWPGLPALLDRVFSGEAVSGAAARRADGAAFSADLLPLRAAEGGVAGALVTLLPAACLAQGAEASREVAWRQDFVPRLTDAIRHLADPLEIQEAALRFLGRHLGADRLFYCQVDGNGDGYVIERSHAPAAPPLIGRFPSGGLCGPALGVGAGRLVVVEDAAADPRLTEAERAAYADLGVRAALGVPLIRDGRWVAGLGVHQTRARQWTAEEIALVRETAERTWPAVERARAEAARRESEARFRELFEAIDEGVMVIERAPRPDGARDWRYVAMNPASQRMFGTADLTGQSMRDNFPQEDEGWYELYDQALETGQVPRFEREARSQGMVVQMYLARVDAPERQRVMVVMQDVTARLRAEAALRASEERFRSFAETSVDVIYIVDVARTRIDYVSPAYERIWGETREAITRDLGRWAEMLHPEDRAEAEARMRLLYEDATARVTVADYRILRADTGEVRHIHDTAVPIRDGSGRLVRVAGIAQDVTETVRATRALRESEARFRTLAEGVPQLVWRAGPKGAWRWASPQWVAATGLSDEASREDGWLEAVEPPDRPAALEAWRHAPSTGQLAFDARLRTTTGPRWFQTRATPVRAGKGRIVEWLGTCTDIDEQMRRREVLRRSGEELEGLVAHRTAELQEAMERLRREAAERHAAEAKLRQGERLQAIGQLTGGIAHDFNNMLQAVLAALSIMRARVEAGRVTELARYIDRAEAGAERAAALTRRLLAFARQQVLQPEPVRIDQVARGMEEMIRRSVGPEIQVELRPGNGRWLVLCDAGELENALLNLCVNARDAMPGGGWLTIATEERVVTEAQAARTEGARPGRYATLSVTDTGLGMPPAVAGRAFEPFFTTKPIGKGTGLGLSQIWGFVQQSGGFMTIDTAPERGTAVRIALPFHAEDPEPEAARGPGLGRTVLLVDGEAEVRELAAESLRGQGYRVLEAGSAEAALRLLDARPQLDVLVTDAGLPGTMDGLGLLAALRAAHPGLPAAVVTGRAGGPAVGNAVLLRKPCDPAALIEALRRMLERSG